MLQESPQHTLGSWVEGPRGCEHLGKYVACSRSMDLESKDKATKHGEVQNL